MKHYLANGSTPVREYPEGVRIVHNFYPGPHGDPGQRSAPAIATGSAGASTTERWRTWTRMVSATPTTSCCPRRRRDNELAAPRYVVSALATTPCDLVWKPPLGPRYRGGSTSPQKAPTPTGGQRVPNLHVDVGRLRVVMQRRVGSVHHPVTVLAIVITK